MTGWMTADELAEDAGVPAPVVVRALRLTGMDRASERHAQGEGDERRYSPGAQALVLREIRSRPGWTRDAG